MASAEVSTASTSAPRHCVVPPPGVVVRRRWHANGARGQTRRRVPLTNGSLRWQSAQPFVFTVRRCSQTAARRDRPTQSRSGHCCCRSGESNSEQELILEHKVERKLLLYAERCCRPSLLRSIVISRCGTTVSVQYVCPTSLLCDLDIS